MVEIVLAVAVFLLTVAVVGLFAMMGELSSRVPSTHEEPQETTPPQPVEDARLGVLVEKWPDELAHLSDVDTAVIAVLSTVCTTCRRIASGQTGPLVGLSAMVVSCPRESRGAEFLAEHPMLGDYPVALDVGGDWLTSNFDVDVSPSVLVFEFGRLVSAHTFTTAPALQLLHIPPHYEKEGIHAGETAAA